MIHRSASFLDLGHTSKMQTKTGQVNETMYLVINSPTSLQIYTQRSTTLFENRNVYMVWQMLAMRNAKVLIQEKHKVQVCIMENSTETSCHLLLIYPFITWNKNI